MLDCTPTKPNGRSDRAGSAGLVILAVAVGLTNAALTPTAADAAIENSNLFVANRGTNKVMEYDSSTGGEVGTFANGNNTALSDPTELTFGPDGDDLYVTSRGNGKVLRYDAKNEKLLGTAAEANLTDPHDLAFGPGGDLFVTENTGFNSPDRVQRYEDPDNDGNFAFKETFVDGSSGGFTLNRARGLDFGPDGDLFVSAGASDTVHRFDGPSGERKGSVSIPVTKPTGLTVEYGDDLYVAQQFPPPKGAQAKDLSGDGLGGPPALLINSDTVGDVALGPNGKVYVTAPGLAAVYGGEGTQAEQFINDPADGPSEPVGLTFGPGADPNTIEGNLDNTNDIDDTGLTPGDNDDSDTTIEIIEQKDNPSNKVLRLSDTADSGPDNAASVGAQLKSKGQLKVSFDYRFLTPGKFEIIIDGDVRDTINAPSMVPMKYFKEFERIFKVKRGVQDFKLKLSNKGDPEIRLDNYSITTTPIPEPAGFALLTLATGAVGLTRARRPHRNSSEAA